MFSNSFWPCRMAIQQAKTEVCGARVQLFNSTSDVELDPLFSADSNEGDRLLPLALGRELGISRLDAAFTFTYNNLSHKRQIVCHGIKTS